MKPTRAQRRFLESLTGTPDLVSYRGEHWFAARPHLSTLTACRDRQWVDEADVVRCIDHDRSRDKPKRDPFLGKMYALTGLGRTALEMPDA